VTVNEGVVLGYEEHGSGEPIIWIPGTGLSGRIWSPYQLPAFRDRYRCLAVDLRGTGESDAPTEPEYTVALLTKDIEDLVRATGIPRAHFVGFSLGGAVVQELALGCPELVASAVLLSSWASTPREHHLRRHYQARLIALERGPIEVFRAFGFWVWAPSLIDDEPDRAAELEALVAQAGGSITAEAYANHFRADLSHDALERLHEIRCPTLVLYGAEDLITLPRYNRTLAERIPGSELVEVPGAGHMACVERPQEVNAAIRSFLEHHPIAQPVGANTSEG
jgi:pimeloyl-ACP methyl ester carboxylesterase